LSEKQIGNTISFNIIDGLDSAAQFSAASRHQSPDIDLRLKLDKRQSEFRVILSLAIYPTQPVSMCSERNIWQRL